MKDISTSLLHGEAWMIKPIGINSQKSFTRQRTRGGLA